MLLAEALLCAATKPKHERGSYSTVPCEEDASHAALTIDQDLEFKCLEEETQDQVQDLEFKCPEEERESIMEAIERARDTCTFRSDKSKSKSSEGWLDFLHLKKGLLRPLRFRYLLYYLQEYNLGPDFKVTSTAAKNCIAQLNDDERPSPLRSGMISSFQDEEKALEIKVRSLVTSACVGLKDDEERRIAMMAMKLTRSTPANTLPKALGAWYGYHLSGPIDWKCLLPVLRALDKARLGSLHTDGTNQLKWSAVTITLNEDMAAAGYTLTSGLVYGGLKLTAHEEIRIQEVFKTMSMSIDTLGSMKNPIKSSMKNPIKSEEMIDIRGFLPLSVHEVVKMSVLDPTGESGVSLSEFAVYMEKKKSELLQEEFNSFLSDLEARTLAQAARLRVGASPLSSPLSSPRGETGEEILLGAAAIGDSTIEREGIEDVKRRTREEIRDRAVEALDWKRKPGPWLKRLV